VCSVFFYFSLIFATAAKFPFLLLLDSPTSTDRFGISGYHLTPFPGLRPFPFYLRDPLLFYEVKPVYRLLPTFRQTPWRHQLSLWALEADLKRAFSFFSEEILFSERKNKRWSRAYILGVVLFPYQDMTLCFFGGFLTHGAPTNTANALHS